jgi:hypothetical protein
MICKKSVWSSSIAVFGAVGALALTKAAQPVAPSVGVVRDQKVVTTVVNAPHVERAVAPTAPSPWFNRQCSHWGEIDDSFLDYMAVVKPQRVQVGFFGPEYYAALGYMKEKSTAALWTSLGGGPADREWWRRFIQKAHAQNVKVIGMFSLSLVFGDAEKSRGWFGYIDKYWDEAVLGPKLRNAQGAPITALDMMQIDAPQRTVGNLHSDRTYKIEDGTEYRGCPSNPYWRAALKRFVKAGIELGLDGFMVIFPSRGHCVCEYCQAGFKKYLSERYSPTELQAKFGIANLPTHHFATMDGWDAKGEASALSLEAVKFTQFTVWDCRREVFVEYGRTLKPDLLLGQWNHIYRGVDGGVGPEGTFAQLDADERSVLPTELWAKDENWVWYSIGNWSLFYKPEAGEYSQFSLEHKYLREAGRGLPQAVKRDDGQNLRVYIAEAVAHGGFAYGRGPDYKDPATQEVVKTYFSFLRRYEDLYRPIQSYSDVALIFPRSAVHRGDTSAIPDFKNLGRILTRHHVPFDVVVDEMLTWQRLKKYRILLQPQSGSLTAEDSTILRALNLQSVVDAPAEVVSVIWQQPGQRRLLLHLVNYKRNSAPGQAVSGAAAERPLPQQNIKVHLKLPAKAKVRRVTLLSPESPDPQTIAFKQDSSTVNCTVAEMLVYAVLNVELK